LKYIILTASLLSQICLGGLYAWSAFVPALKSSYGLSTSETQLIFGLLIAVFTLTMVPAGRLLESSGPRLPMILSGLLFGVGYLIASFSGGAFVWLLLGFGVVAGTATGFGYPCPLSACIEWFPRHKGLVTGIAVAGIGAGAIVLTSLVEKPLERGTDVLLIFRWIGAVYGSIILLAGVLMRYPAERCHKHTDSASLTGFPGRDPFFWAMTCAMFCGTFAGLLVIGNLMPMALASGIQPVGASYAISAFAVGNAAGRITWGLVVDRKKADSIQMSLGFLALALIGLLWNVSNAAYFALISLLTGFGFGACFVIHAALVGTRYGASRFGRIYPPIFLAYGLAGIAGPAIGGWLFDRTGSYGAAIVLSIAVVLTGLLICGLLLKRSQHNP